MGYMHINNLYKDQRILMFRECWALEKVHGTSAHVQWDGRTVTYYGGGEPHDRFKALFDGTALIVAFEKLGQPSVTVNGEAYGGRQQGMKDTYGPELRFIAFDVQVGEHWLSVPDMEQVATSLGFEVVPYRKVSTDLAALDAERDRPSEVAIRRGIAGEKMREGVVLRPLVELRANNGERIIAKHKGEKFEERRTPQRVVDPAALAVLGEANAIAEEWVTEMRLSHVLDKLPNAQIEDMPKIIAAMVEDVCREAKGEIVESKAAKGAIGKRTALLFKERLKAQLRAVQP